MSFIIPLSLLPHLNWPCSCRSVSEPSVDVILPFLGFFVLVCFVFFNSSFFSASTVLTLHPERLHVSDPSFLPLPFILYSSSPLPSLHPSIYPSLSVDRSPLGHVDSWMALCLTRVLAGGSAHIYTHTHTPTNAHAYTHPVSIVSKLLSCEAPSPNSVCVCEGGGGGGGGDRTTIVLTIAD